MTLLRADDLPTEGFGAPAPSAPPGASFGDAFGAAMRTENPIGAAVNSEFYGRAYAREPIDNYSPFDDIDGYEDHAGRFVGARHAEDTAAIKREIDRYRREKQTIDSSGGLTGFITETGAALLSPTTLLPGGAIIRSAAGGVSALRTARSAALAGGTAAGVDEAILGATQTARTREEMLLGLAGGTILSGALGAGVGALAKRAARRDSGVETGDPIIDAGNDAAATTMRDDMAARLRGAGFDDVAAESQADLVSSFYRAMAGRADRSVDDLAAEFPLPEVRRSDREADGISYDQNGRMDLKRWRHLLSLASPQRRDFNPYFPTPTPLRTLGVKTGRVVVPTRALMQIRRKHGDVPREVLDNLPELLETPLFVFKHKDGGLNLVLDAQTAKGEPIIVGIREGQLRTITPKNDIEGGLTGRERMLALVANALDESGRVYAKNKEALTEARASGSEQGRTNRAGLKGTGAKVVFEVPPVKKFDQAMLADGYPRGQITIPDAVGETPVITLMRDADASTFLHEAGHLFLHMFRQMARAEGGPPNLRADMDALNAWWRQNADAVAEDGGVEAAQVRDFIDKGTTGDQSIDDAVGVGMQEQWARGFEDYLREGNAPSPELAGMFNRFRQWLLDVYDSAKALNVEINNDVRGVMDRMLYVDRKAAFDGEARALSDDLMGVAKPGDSVGASAAASSDPASENIVRAFGFDKAARAIGDPIAALQSSPSVTARRLAPALAETATRLEKNASGVATERSVESHIRKWEGRLFKGLRGVDEAFLKYRGIDARKSDAGMEMQVVKTAAKDAASRGGRMHMSYREFKEEIGRALRNGGDHSVPEIAEAAQKMRDEVYAPLRDEAINLGLLPEDIATSADADRYLNRVYNIDRIVKRRDGFIRVVSDWLEQEQVKKAALQARAAELDADLRGARQRAKNAVKRQDNARRKLELLEARAAEQLLAENRNSTRYDRLQARHDEIDAEIADIHSEIEQIKGDKRDASDEVWALNRDIAALERERAAAIPAEDADRKEAMDFIKADPVFMDAFKVMAGRKKAPRIRTIIDDIVESGGIKGSAAELAAIGITNKTRPGLINKGGLSLEDRVGERLTEIGYPGVAPDDPGINSRDAILVLLRQQIEGDAIVSPVQKGNAPEVHALMEAIANAARSTGEDASTPQGFFRIMAGLDAEGGAGRVTLDDIDRELAEMEASGGSVVEPVGGAVEALSAQRDGIKALRASLAKAIAAKARTVGKRRVASARRSERGMEANAQRSRGDVLADRIYRAELHVDAMDALSAGRQADEATIRESIEDIVLEWEGHSSAEAKSAIKGRQKAELARAERLSDKSIDPGEAPRMAAADKAVGKALRKILSSDQGRERIELNDVAAQIADRIIGSPDGRLPYDEAGSPSISSRGPGQTRGPMKARVFQIPDDFATDAGRFEDFLESDVEIAARLYVNTMAPDVELSRKFGVPEEGAQEMMTSQLRSLELEYDRLFAQAETEGQRATLERRKQNDLAAVRGIRDRLRGTYALPADPNGWAYRGQNFLLGWNMMRLLGGMTLSAIPDAFRVVMQNGFKRGGLDAALTSMRPIAGGEARRAVLSELQAMGTATDILMSSRLMSIADVTQSYHRLSKLERGQQAAASMFGKVSLMNYWNQQMKTMAGMVTFSRMVPAINDLAQGRASEKDLGKLAQMGIDGPMADRMARMIADHGDQVEGIVMPNTSAWADAEAAELLRGALAAEVDRIIVTPGQERPLWMSRQGWRLLGQFRSFSVAAMQRVTIAGLQQRDAYAVAGLMGSIGLGTLSYAAKTLAAERDISDDPAVLFMEGFDRSGVTGWLFDAHNMLEKATRGGISLMRGLELAGLADESPQMSRYASRNIVGAILGPSVGTFTDVAQSTGALFDDDASQSDVRAFRRLAPAQNLFWLRPLINDVEEASAELMGVE